MESIAFLGTGLMGAPMAARLVGAGLSVTVYNRTRAKAEPLISAGARWANDPVAAVQGASVIITMLTNADAVDKVLFDTGAFEQISPGSVVIDMTSTSPPVARRHAERLKLRNIDYVDAPVSGGTRGATSGALAIMAGGDAAVIGRLMPVFAPMGTARRVGPTGSGQLSKLCNQLIVAVTIGAVAEALVLAEKGGADPTAVREALRGGFAESRILAEHGQRMLDRNFTPGGAVDNQIKDLVAAEGFADSVGAKLNLLHTVHEMFNRLRASHGGNLDHSSLFLEVLGAGKTS